MYNFYFCDNIGIIMREKYSFIILFILIFTFPLSAHSKEPEKPVRGLFEAINKIFDGYVDNPVTDALERNGVLSTRFPPRIQDVNVVPEHPGEGEDVTISVMSTTDIDDEDAAVVSMRVFWSGDNGLTWNVVDMDYDGDTDLWSGIIPGQESGTEVVWGLRAADTFDNVYMDAPCMVDMPIDKMPLEDVICSINNLDNCRIFAHTECVFSLAQDENIVIKDMNTPESLDFLDVRFGFDENKFYFDLVLKGEWTAGSASPLDIFGHGIVFLDFNTDNYPALDDFKNGTVLLSIPLGKLAGGLIKPCALFYPLQAEDAMVQNSDVTTCTVKNNHQYFTLDRVVAPVERLRLFSASGTVRSISPYEEIDFDTTPVTDIVLLPRTIHFE